MNRYHPRSPGARLSALRRALWQEDRAREALLLLRRRRPGMPALQEADGALNAARAERMEAEREFWEARAGHALD